MPTCLHRNTLAGRNALSCVRWKRC